MSQRQKIILGSILAIIIIVPIIWWTVSRTTSDSSIITDRDTGEVFNPEVNSEDTGGGSNVVSPVILFGIEPFTEKQLELSSSVGYVNSVKAALWDFSQKRLDDEFSSLTLRPNGLSVSDNEIRGTVRLGQTDAIIPVIIRPNTTGGDAIITLNEDGSQYGGTYSYVGGINNPNNLLFTISQPDNTSERIEIQSYGNYYEAAFEYLESVGYRVPDLTITIVDKGNKLGE
jgi:hypothetical protein